MTSRLESVDKGGVSARYQFVVLFLVVMVAGLSQGLLLPLLSILLDQSGVSADRNGMNSAALYIGVFCTMFFIEKPVQRFGYRKVILAGIVLVTAAMLLFPVGKSLTVWFILRLLVGVGDSALHYSTQLWIVSTSPADRRGTYISLYGMSYGTGFSLGPLGLNLLPLGEAVPFLVSSGLFLLVLLLVIRLPNQKPERVKEGTAQQNRYIRTYKLAWFVLIPGFLYGFLEASMNSTFPLYGLRIGLSQAWLSVLLLAFGVGSLILQLPLGMWSDRIGRKPVLIGCGVIGSIVFFLIPAAGDHRLLLMLLFVVGGGMVGSFYSLGLAYAADVLPRPILPAANVIASIHFSLGSIIGPGLAGLGMRYVSLSSLFVFLGAAFGLFALLGFAYKPRGMEEEGAGGLKAE
ncbi:MFS transporter [Paenibacillus sp. GCM10023252]|uniref:MFS transporter n=1 Tax=Paenibacillus sp. GCM10023252 TaxID=3252649 RepID=UPI00360F046A